MEDQHSSDCGGLERKLECFTEEKMQRKMLMSQIISTAKALKTLNKIFCGQHYDKGFPFIQKY